MKLNKDASSVSKSAGRPAKRTRPERAPPLKLKSGFPIVGVGGSAGGLEAFTQLLEHLPVDTGMAFVFVQHLYPEHESALPHILSRATRMPVHEATQGMMVRPNEVYVIPPGVTMSLARGRLRLALRDPTRMPHLSIDSFFQSLAREQDEGAIGVVFSGSATDGTNGLEAIKAAGGIAFAQDKSARYDSMPRHAIASGCVDYVMAPDAVARELARIASHPYLRGDLPPLPSDSVGNHDAAPAPEGRRRTKRARAPAAAPQQGLEKILEFAQEQSGVDFSLYKTSTIHRRITRRMLLCRKNSIDEYARFVAADAKEFKALYADMLISVTSFFRDEAAFDVLKKVVFPKIIGERRADTVRIWTLGCSSGQETYSLAMAFMEVAAQLPGPTPHLQIFGTDLNEALLNRARHGLYSKTVAQEISPERLRKFFVEEDGGYRVIKALREVCIFARQDLLSDPPFSRMDLVSCRNVLIYIEPAAQKRVLPMLHYALQPEGFLFLGMSESIGVHDDLFEPRDKKQKIFARRATTTPAFSLPRRERRRPDLKERRVSSGAAVPEDGLRVELHAHHEADRITVNLFAPPGVLIDAAMNVLQFRGATEAYLTPPSGKASFQLLKLAREALVLPLRTAINRARKQKEPVRRENVRLSGPAGGSIDLHVIPLRNLRDPYFLVLFETPPAREAGKGAPRLAAAPAAPRGERQLRRRNAQLERELAETRDYLQSLQQQHDIAHDELQASNEEVQSTNEELQSINEELETSKEELESGNEELITVNEEMAYRNGELSRLNSDLNNFHVSLSTPIVVLGRDLTIRRFTPMAEKLFNLLATDVGRPIAGIKHNLMLDDIEGFVGKVIDLIAVRESEVRDKDGHWYLLRARPYLTVDNKIDGAVLVLLDIDALKRSEEAIAQERDYAEATLRTARDSLIILRPDLTVNTANDAFYRTFALTPAQTENRLLFELADGAWNIPALRGLLADILPRNHFFNDLEVTHDFGGLGPRTMLLNGRRLDSAEGAPLRILLSIEDVTERLRSRAVLRASEIRYRRLFEAAKDGVLILDPETRQITEANPFMVQLLGYRRDELIGRELFEIGLFRDARAAQEVFVELRQSGHIRYEHLPLRAKDGSAHHVEVIANLYDEDGRTVIQCNVRDITDRKRMEDALRRSEARFEAIITQATAGIAELDLAGKFTLVNERFCAMVGRTAEELRGMRASEITHHDDLEVIAARFATLARDRIDFTMEKRYLRPDGSEVWVSNSVAWISDEDDVPVSFVEISQDISERKRLEMALHASEAYFRELTQSLPLGAWTSLPDGTVDFINRYWIDYIGMTVERTPGRPKAGADALHPGDRTRVEQKVAASQASGEGCALEARYREAATGNYRWFLRRSVPVRDAAGGLQKRIDICIDIDDLKQAQAILAGQAGALEAQVQARTGELRETIGELEAFSYSVSHDMRAPLRAMQGFALLLLKNHESSLDARSLDQLRRINASAGRMDLLINDVLTYSRLLRSEIVLQPVNLDDLVRLVIATYPNLQANGAEIAIEELLPTVLANEAGLTQCVSNLLSNAVKFVAPGATARVRVRADEIEGDVRLWIEDEGIGIDPANHARIWNIFTRIGRARDYDGTGIGLAIVRKAVERMNGKIGLESSLGHGSKFWIRLRKG